MLQFVLDFKATCQNNLNTSTFALMLNVDNTEASAMGRIRLAPWDGLAMGLSQGLLVARQNLIWREVVTGK